MYYDCENVDGYIRDKCVFSPEIDIYDTMSVNVKYKSGALLTYSLIAHSPYEGYKLSISGTNGRLEAEELHGLAGNSIEANYITIYNRKGQKIEYNIPKSGGGHGGGDIRLRAMIFEGGVADHS